MDLKMHDKNSCQPNPLIKSHQRIRYIILHFSLGQECVLHFAYDNARTFCVPFFYLIDISFLLKLKCLFQHAIAYVYVR